MRLSAIILAAHLQFPSWDAPAAARVYNKELPITSLLMIREHLQLLNPIDRFSKRILN